MNNQVCPHCPGTIRLIQGDDSHPVCARCGYTSSVATTFFDERDEMMEQLDVAERYSGLLRDNTLGGARVLRDRHGRAFQGQNNLKRQLAELKRRQALKEWVNHLTKTKLKFNDFIAARAMHIADSIIDGLKRQRHGIGNHYIAASCIMICALDANKVINEMEMAASASLDLDKLKEHLAFCRRELNLNYNSSIQPASYIETLLRHVKAIIETPDESRLHNKSMQYPDQVVAFLHTCHPSLLEIRKMATDLGEMAASLSLSYARNPGISAASIVYAAMEGVAGRYLSLNGVIFAEFAASLPKASTFTIRERYLEIITVVFDLGRYLVDIGHPVHHIPAWRQMATRPPPRRHLFTAILPSVVRHWKQLFAVHQARGAVPIQATDTDLKNGKELWSLLFPDTEYPGGPEKNQVDGNQASQLDTPPDNQAEGSGTSPRGASPVLSEIGSAGASNGRKRKRCETVNESENLDKAPKLKARVRKALTPEQKARKLVQNREYRARVRAEKYLRPSVIELTPLAPSESTSLVSGNPVNRTSQPETTGHWNAQRDVFLENRRLYERRRVGNGRQGSTRSPLVIRFLKQWQKDHGTRDESAIAPVGVAIGASTHASYLRALLLSGAPPSAIPSEWFPSSVLTAKVLLSQNPDLHNVSDEDLWEEGELDGYVCTQDEIESRQRQWHEEGNDTYLAVMAEKRAARLSNEQRQLLQERGEAPAQTEAGLTVMPDAFDDDDEDFLAYQQSADDLLQPVHLNYHAASGPLDFDVEPDSDKEENDDDHDDDQLVAVDESEHEK